MENTSRKFSGIFGRKLKCTRNIPAHCLLLSTYHANKGKYSDILRYYRPENRNQSILISNRSIMLK